MLGDTSQEKAPHLVRRGWQVFFFSVYVFIFFNVLMFYSHLDFLAGEESGDFRVTFPRLVNDTENN